MLRNAKYVVALVALMLGISACSSPTTPAPVVKVAATYVPSALSTIVGAYTEPISVSFNGKPVELVAGACSTSAGVVELYQGEVGKIRVQGLVVGSHELRCTVPGADDGKATITVTPPPLLFDIEYSWDTPVSIEGDPRGLVSIRTGTFISNGEPGAMNACDTVWTPTPTTANTWKCSGVSFERGKTYYIRVGDVNRRLACNPSCGTGFGDRIKVGGILLQRVGAYFVDPRGLVRLDFDQDGKPY